MNRKWKIKDIIDLEFFLLEEENIEASAPDGEGRVLADRKVFLEDIQPFLNKEATGANAYRRIALRIWLEKKREKERVSSGVQTVLPGNVFDDFFRLFLFIFGVTGLFLGTGGSVAFLSYSGTAPINVSIYLGMFVFTQIALITGFIFLFLFRRQIYLLRNLGPVYQLIGALLVRAITAVKGRTFEKLPAKERNRISAALGLVSGAQKIYGPVFYSVPFLLIQMLGIGFNLGVLIGTFGKVLSSDLAFGWQSTIQFSADTIYRMVTAMSLPWSWLVTQGIAHPTLEQVEGSKMVLKDGIYHLATSDLVAWWPFLCLCVLFYGLLPRLVLAVSGWIGQSVFLRRMDFSHEACDRLIRRLQTPIVQTKGDPFFESGSGPVSISPLAADQLSSQITFPDESAIVLVHEDIFDRISEERLSKAVKHTLGSRLLKKIKTGIDPETDLEAVRSFMDSQKESSSGKVVFLQEAWQPPIKEGVSFLKDVRKIIGQKRKMVLLLIGKSSQAQMMPPASLQEKEIWAQAVKKLADPYLQVEMVGDASEKE